MLRLLAILPFAFLSIFNVVPISAAITGKISSSASREEIILLLRQHGSASEEIYCLACGLATELDNQPPPKSLIRDFERISPEFEDFYNLVRRQLASKIGGFGENSISKDQRGPVCTDMLQPFVADVIANVVEGIREGVFELEGFISDSDLNIAYEQFRTDLDPAGTPLYGCSYGVDEDILDGQYDQV